jgi:hypothetical protein
MIYGAMLRNARAASPKACLIVKWAPISQTCHTSPPALRDGGWHPCSSSDHGADTAVEVGHVGEARVGFGEAAEATEVINGTAGAQGACPL